MSPKPFRHSMASSSTMSVCSGTASGSVIFLISVAIVYKDHVASQKPALEHVLFGRMDVLPSELRNAGRPPLAWRTQSNSGKYSLLHKCPDETAIVVSERIPITSCLLPHILFIRSEILCPFVACDIEDVRFGLACCFYNLYQIVLISSHLHIYVVTHSDSQASKCLQRSRTSV